MSTFSVVIACRRSPVRLLGATSVVCVVDVESPRECRLWDPEARTLRFHRDLAGIVTLTGQFRWADFITELAALIAHASDGIVAVADEVLGDVKVTPHPDPLGDRDLALAWRAIDNRARVALDDYHAAAAAKVVAPVRKARVVYGRRTSRPL